ncbi:MAG: DNA-3-methyladenine glycosylase I [Kiloniellales bacterium]
MNKGFRPIEDAAIKHAGGKAALEKRLPKPKSSEALRAVGDDRYLSMMSLRVFRAGLKHSLVDGRWPAFEEVFLGFEPRRVRAMSDEALEGLMADSRLIRHWGKIKATRDNAAAMCRVIEEQGSFGGYLAAWPGGRIVELWDDIAKRFSQMGGNSGPYFLRMAGKDTFLLTGDVVRALDHWRAFKGDPKAKKSRAAVQALFNDWSAETGRPLCQLSMILALSVS